MLSYPTKMRILSILAKNSWKKKLHFSRNALFHMKTKKEILKAISSLDNNKATEIKNILIMISKLAKQRISEYLFFIYNVSFTTGVFPDSLKIAEITSVYKKVPNLSVLWNYRSFSLLSNLDNIIEKPMHKRLMGLSNDQKVLYKKQLQFLLRMQ